MAVRISVIIPAYNAAMTLRAAAESILSQPVDGLELIVVDDGSTDDTARVCHDLTLQDMRVRVITQKNGGICAARNRGLSTAAGEYIAFCDDDDHFLPDALSRLLDTAETTQADVVRGDYLLLREEPDGQFREQPHDSGMRCCMWEEGYSVFLQNSGPQFVWNALYRKTALAGIFFDERCRYGLEDFIFNMTLYTRTDRAVYIPQAVYRHFERAQSTSVCRSAEAFRGRVRALEPWMEAEYAALIKRCPPQNQTQVWLMRKTEAITFLMHQLRDAKAPAALRQYAWQSLRQVLAGYPSHPLDFLSLARQNKKKTVALLLYELGWQRLYDLL